MYDVINFAQGAGSGLKGLKVEVSNFRPGAPVACSGLLDLDVEVAGFRPGSATSCRQWSRSFKRRNINWPGPAAAGLEVLQCRSSALSAWAAGAGSGLEDLNVGV